MLPTVPATVWEQVAVVVIFAFLLAGLGWILVKIFTTAIADVNAHYANLLKDTNMQWQKYFDARSESSNLLAEKMTLRMDQIALILGKLVTDFEDHDQMERQALDEMSNKRKLAKKNPNI